MSANNQLLITRNGEKFRVTNIDVDTGSGYEIANEETLEKAIEAANKEMEETPVEYGLNINI